MTHVVTDACVKCKYTDCVEVCPVECFYEGEFMVVIDPNECIDCGVCIAECPIGAIEVEAPHLINFIEFANKVSTKWDNITKKKAPLPDAELYKNETNKFARYIASN